MYLTDILNSRGTITNGWGTSEVTRVPDVTSCQRHAPTGGSLTILEKGSQALWASTWRLAIPKLVAVRSLGNTIVESRRQVRFVP